MREPHRIILGPLITEKGKKLKDENNQYCFKVEGKANKDLKRLIAKAVGVPKSAVTIASGEKSRKKRLVVEGCRAEQVLRGIFGGGRG